MAKHGKSYNAAAEKIDRAALYTPLQAAKLIKELDAIVARNTLLDLLGLAGFCQRIDQL